MSTARRGTPWWAAVAAGLVLAGGPGCDGGGDDDSADPGCTAPVDRWTVGEVVATEGCGILARADGSWGGDLWILRVEGSDYEMGYQYGALAGDKLLDLWWTYIGMIGEELGASDPDDADMIAGQLLDQAWALFEPHTAAESLDLMRGVADGMTAAGLRYGTEDDGTLVFIQRIVALAEFAVSSHMDADNLLGLVNLLANGFSDELLDYYGVEARSEDGDDGLADLLDLSTDPRIAAATEGSGRLQCSVYGAWGDRTEGGALIGGRNMDFTAGTGIYEYASIAVFVPDDGVAYANWSWLGLNLGGLAGINAKGVTMGNVQSSTPLERFDTESGVLRGSRMLKHATDLDSALTFLDTAPSVGVAGMVAWGDADGGGADAQAAAFEQNGLSFAFHHNHHDCSTDTRLLRFAYDGSVTDDWTDETNPQLANLEADAVEIDGEANPRYFMHDGTDYVLDEEGHYIEVDGPDEGQTLRTGYTLPCAVYRGDPALANGVRMHQTASNGPGDGGDGLMNDAGAFRERYRSYYSITQAYEQGTAFEWRGEEIVADHGGEQVLIGLDQMEVMSRAAAMENSNTWDGIFDATNLILRLSYESGTGDDWIGAHEQPPYMEIDLHDLFLLD